MTEKPAENKLSWTPSADTSHRILAFFAVGGALIGVVGFSISFRSVSAAGRPYFGDASWTLPVLIDLGIFTLAGLALFLEMNGLKSRLARLIPQGLALYTLYLNTATQPSLFGKLAHAAGPILWITVVELSTITVRRLLGLLAANRIEGIRRSLWLLRPLATWRLWRAMRIYQISTYLEALDRAAARSAVTGRLRLHYGRLWRWNAPLAERIALRLDGRDPAGVAANLRTHTDTAALLSSTALTPAVSEPAPTAEKIANPDTPADTKPSPDPAVWIRPRGPVSARRRLPTASRNLRQARTTQAPQTSAQQPGQAPLTATAPGQEPDRTASTQASRKRVSVRPAVVAMRAVHPNMTADTIADILGVSERTVVRHLSAPEAQTQHANGHPVSA